MKSFNVLTLGLLFSLSLLACSCNKGNDEDERPVATSQEEPKDSIVEFSQVSVEVPGSYKLNAALTLPAVDRSVPGIIIVPGSGAVNLDGQIVGDATAYPPVFKQWAEFFSERGVAVLRYDKRVISNPDLNSLELSQEDQIDDIKSCIDFLEEQQGVDASSMYLLGFSEGGNLIAPAANDDSRIRGLFVVSSASFSIDSLLHEQLRLNSGQSDEVLAQVDEAFQLVRKGRFPKGQSLLGGGQDYWKQWIHYSQNAISILKQSRAEVYIVQGMADENFPGETLSKNLKGWEKAAQHKHISLKTVSGASHALLKADKSYIMWPMHWLNEKIEKNI